MAFTKEFIETLHKEYERLKSQRRIYEHLWQELAEYILPRKSNINIKRAVGAKLTERVFDSTAGHANQILAANIHGALTNPVIQWYALKLKRRDLNAGQRIKVWLDQCSYEMFAAIQESNFDAEINEVYLDLGAFGIGALLVEEQDIRQARFNGLHFKSIPLGEYTVAENTQGIVDTIFIEYEWVLKDVVQKFGIDSLSQDQKSSFEQSSGWNKPITCIYAVFPRDGVFVDQDVSGKPWDWISIYYDTKEKHVFNQGGYYEFPVMVPRWAKTSGEVYGRGPGDTARPDIRSLNRAKQMDLKAWAKEIDPPMTALQNSVLGGVVKLTPGAVNIVTDHQAIQSIQSGARHDITMLKTSELQTSIRQIFFNDQLQLPDKTIITATEVIRRLELMNRVLGPTVGRLNRELLSPMLARIFGIMYRTGALPEAPQEFLEAALNDSADVFIEYEGLLAKAQRGTVADSVERLYVVATPMINTHPEVLDNLNDDEMFRDLVEQVGMPAKYVRELGDVEGIREARLQVAREQAAREAAMQQVEAASKLGGIPSAAISAEEEF